MALAQQRKITGVDLKEVKENIDENHYETVREFFGSIKFEEIDDKIKRGFISLKIRYLIEINEYAQVIKIIDEFTFSLMKRDYIAIIISIYQDNRKMSMDIFKKYILDNHKLENTDIDKFIQNGCVDILLQLKDYFVECSEKSNISTSDYSKFKKYNINDSLKKKMLDIYREKISRENFEDLVLKIKDIDCIVDGGNISHINGGECDYSYIEKLSEKIGKKFQNPLYIFHYRHKKKISKFLEGKNFFITPIREYDDIYMIIAMILTDKPIITNDNFKDHIEIFKSCDTIDFKIKNYISQNIINYSKKNINNIKSYSKCIQFIEDKLYIPTSDGMFSI